MHFVKPDSRSRVRELIGPKPQMDSARWERIQSLFHEAIELLENERAIFLESACAGDDALLADVLAMLEEDGQSKSVLDSDVAHLAALIAPRKLVIADGVAPGGEPVTEPGLRASFAFTRGVFAMLKADKQLTVIKNGEIPDLLNA